MSIFRKIEVGILAFLLIVLVALGGQAWYSHKAHKAAVLEGNQYAGDAEAHSTAAAAYRNYVVEKENASVKLEQALEQNEEWAHEPLPADVADQLRHDSGSARAVP